MIFQQPKPRAGVRLRRHALRLAIGEVEALAAMLLVWFAPSDWYGVDSLLVFRTGGTDAELLDLFKHNRQVLHRSDEDVIAAMTRPR